MPELSRKPLFSTRSTSRLRSVPSTGWTTSDEDHWIAEQNMLREQRLIALREGDTITIVGDRTNLWWFTADVRPVGRIITARTLIMEQRRQAELPFDRVEPLELEKLNQRAEANMFRRRLGLATEAINPTPVELEEMEESLPKPVRDLLRPPSPWNRDEHTYRKAA